MDWEEFWDKHETTAERCSEIFGIDDIMAYTIKEAWEHRDADCATACQDEYPFEEVTFEDFHCWICENFGVNAPEDAEIGCLENYVEIDCDEW